LLVLYTDGITEARADGRLFGYEGLLDVVRSFRECSPEDLAERLYERAKTHARGALQDDVALMVVRRDTEE
jgi:serine phosphatase RsbU (regulator of sigma subunit)